MNILDKIEQPQDLRMLKKELFPQLLNEIREKIIQTVSQNGGHLAGSLGVVELTVALHYVFNGAEDRIVWDVGHQAYTHKLLTGRNRQFQTLRQYDGLSGFPNPGESGYDAFIAGHASNAISAALGLAVARDLKREKHKVIAVVGDGSLSGGLAYEGLNNAGHMQKNILIILNDNEMFISPRVGAIGQYLTRIFTLGIVKSVEKQIERFFSRIKVWGIQMLKVAKRIKVLLFPGMLFEEMGFGYFGPVDGHDLFKLIELLEKIKDFKGPILLHVVTKKGKGYTPAEKNPGKFHGTGPFNIITGESEKKQEIPSFTDIFSQTLIQLARKDEHICAITAAMSEGTGLEPFAREYPERFFDVGIAEEHAVTFSAGLAMAGMKPVCAIYSTFLQRSLDQLIHDVAILDLPVVFAVDRAGIVGEDGVTHQGMFDLSYLRIIPNFIVSAPKDEDELRHLLYSSFQYGHPTAIRYPRGAGLGAKLSKDFHFIPAGKGEIIQKGDDVAILGIGNTLPTLMLTHQLLTQKGLNPWFVNMRFVKPMDEEILHQLRNTKLMITVEENTLCAGFGSAVKESLSDYRGKIINLGLPDAFIPHGHPDKLREVYGLSAEKISETILKSIKKIV
ncbi:MAG TPA: 1-deoxy-D-xylulose-5-phosphate synthase [bacterium]|nr:1-deoxy-D-xylulose-5-phosphate synthase [bacterium]